MTKLTDLIGPRNGITTAYKAIKERGGAERLSYLKAHARGRGYAKAARIHRKHGIFAHPRNLLAIDPPEYMMSKLHIPASDLWHGDLECVSFPSQYGSWKRTDSGELYAPQGGYFSSMNPGHGGNPRVTWRLRTGTCVGSKPTATPLP